ncbi:hypothetical protein D3C86_1753350 [compost metagenome]
MKGRLSCAHFRRVDFLDFADGRQAAKFGQDPLAWSLDLERHLERLAHRAAEMLGALVENDAALVNNENAVTNRVNFR